MSRIAGSSAEVAVREFRRRFVPLISTIVAILLGALPIVARRRSGPISASCS